MSAITRKSIFESFSGTNYFYAYDESNLNPVLLDFTNLNFAVDSINTQKHIYLENTAGSYMKRSLNITGKACVSPCSSEEAAGRNVLADKSTAFKTERNFCCSAYTPLDLSLPSKDLQKTYRKQNTNSHKLLKESDLQLITQTSKSRGSAISGLSGMVIDLSADYYIKP